MPTNVNYNFQWQQLRTLQIISVHILPVAGDWMIKSSAYHSPRGQAYAWEVARQGTGEEDRPSVCLKTYLALSFSVKRGKKKLIFQVTSEL